MNYSSLFVLVNRAFTNPDETYIYTNDSGMTMLQATSYEEEYEGVITRLTSIFLVDNTWAGEIEEFAHAGAIIEVETGSSAKLWRADYPTRYGPL